MAEFEFKVPTSKEEYEEMKKALRQELSEDDLNAVVGGNDSPNLKNKIDPPITWHCNYCGAAVLVRQKQDAAKHMTKCPNNPYK